MKVALTAVLAMVLCSSALALTEAEEKSILMGVVHQYELNEDEARILFAIRKHENGPVGLEFGVGQDEGSGHPARRYSTDPRKSLRLQAEYAAGTIQKRFDGCLMSFAQRWCPKGPQQWHRSVYKILMTTYVVPPRDT